ncbi:hypothetical protein BH20VER1_BH20VER1_14970 [soil metagenome]
MKCPACAVVLTEPAPSCPACKFTLRRLDPKFGAVPRHSRYLTDRGGRLTMAEMNQLRDALRLFHKKFPQTLLSVFVMELPRGSSANEFAFWLANRARFSTVIKAHEENFDLLLVVDLAGKKASLAAGYGLEPHLEEQDLQKALDVLAGPLAGGDIAAGIHAAIETLVRRLREVSRKAQQKKVAMPPERDNW